MKKELAEKAQTEAEFLGYVNKVKDCEHASLVMADDVFGLPVKVNNKCGTEKFVIKQLFGKILCVT